MKCKPSLFLICHVLVPRCALCSVREERGQSTCFAISTNLWGSPAAGGFSKAKLTKQQDTQLQRTYCTGPGSKIRGKLKLTWSAVRTSGGKRVIRPLPGTCAQSPLNLHQRECDSELILTLQCG
uniref:Secreted protein n=1 Tax=Eutreptiella gymnastica TaxID=73025 RepID=A0A7S4G5Z4_9EUGL